MSADVKISGVWRPVIQPWIKVGSRYTRVQKAFLNVNGVWKETWPLQPGQVRSLAVTTVYRNDRIEIDVDWLAPNDPDFEPTTRYIISLDIGSSPVGPFSWSNTTTVDAPTTAVTFTNQLENGIGYNKYAGKQAYVTITTRAATGRNGIPLDAPPVTVAQLPPPPLPTAYSLDIQHCQATHTWNMDTGRRVTGVELMMQFDGKGDVIKRYADTVKSAAYESWNPATIGAGLVTSMVRTYGPGGVSAWRTVSGRLPGPVRTSNYRILRGKMRVDVSGIDPHVEVWYTDRNGPWHNDGTRGPTADVITVDESANWPDNDQREWMMKLRPINVSNDWTGRDQDLRWVRKVPNPYFVEAVNSRTRRGGNWRSETATEYQGATKEGLNACYAFYGGTWFEQLRDNILGYVLNCSSAQIILIRAGGGHTGPVRPRLMLHRATTLNGDLSRGGAYDSTALSRGEAAWCAVPSDWAEQLMQGANEWRGIGLWNPNDKLLSDGMSEEYMVLQSTGTDTVGGHALFTVRVYHDG